MKFPVSTTTAKRLRHGAIAIVLAAPLLLPGQPAEANFLQKLGEILRGDTQEGAQQGNARGAAIRDRLCAAENPNLTGLEDSAAPAGEESQIIILVPNVLAPIKTVSATPEVFVYIPPETNSAPPQSHAVLKQNNSLKQQFDLDDIEFDDVIAPDVINEAERTQEDELVLELEFGSFHQQYSLPPEALIAELKFPRRSLCKPTRMRVNSDFA